MRPFHAIGFKATAKAGYDCSFVIMYPLDAPAEDQQKLPGICQQAVADANRMHGGITVHQQLEKHIMMV